jgi:hypothetical protein
MIANPAMLALGALSALLVAALGLECFGAGEAPAPRPAPALPPIAVAAAPVPLPPPPALVDTILARPLFQASRRPPAVSATPVAGRPAGLPRLTGVMSSSKGKRLIFAPGPDGKPVVVAEGGHIGPYQVKSIGAGSAEVLGPEGLKTLRPAFDATNINTPAGAVLAGPADRNPILDLMSAANRNLVPQPAPAVAAFGARAAANSAGPFSATGPGMRLNGSGPSPATTPGLQP